MPSDLTHRPNICPVEFPTSFVLSVAVCSFIDSYWLITNIIGWFFISLSKQEKLKKVSPHYCWGNLGGVHMSQENNLSTFKNFLTQFCFFISLLSAFPFCCATSISQKTKYPSSAKNRQQTGKIRLSFDHFIYLPKMMCEGK